MQEKLENNFFLENNKRVYPFIRDLRVVGRTDENIDLLD